VRKPNNNPQSKPSYSISPNPQVFGGKPNALLERQPTVPSQTNSLDDIIIYGEDNALPLRIAQAVEESPAASSCIDTIAQFIKGSGFSDPELMKLIVDKNGTTLWDFHCGLADTLALLWGFAVNFKFNEKGKITNSYQMSFESCRFKRPVGKSPYITHIKFNPYFGTGLKTQTDTVEYEVFDPKQALETIGTLKGKERKDWTGQVYYYGKTSPLSRFYPKPKYWSAKEAIQADHKLQEFHNEELDNGFFQSVLINAIGDPNQMSKNPRLQKEITKDDGTKAKVATKTIGEEFNEQMQANFSGSKKAGTAMVLWSLNENQSVKVSAFPTGINGDRIIATQDSITKTITIATKVPSILANISEGVSLGSGGSEIQKAVELMQSRTVEWRLVLENFYNTVMLPNLDNATAARVKIQNFNPISEPVEIDDKFWEFMNEQEKVAFIKKNLPQIEIIRTPVVVAPVTPAPTVDPVTGETVQQPATTSQPNEALKNLKIADLNKIQKIVARYNLWKVNPQDAKALTYDQAKQMLSSFGFTEEELNAWLVTPDEL